MRCLLIPPLLLVLAACSGGGNTAPDLPQSVTPAWKQTSLTQTSGPCWNAAYASGGSAIVNACRYSSDAMALDAAQHAHSEANAVHFQQGRWFVIVRWNNVSQAEITALVRAVQKSLDAH